MKRLYFRTTLLAVFACFAAMASAQTDVTKTYIENPDFEARFAGWHNHDFAYQTNSAFSQKNGKVYMERWISAGSSLGDLDIYQELNLPAGTYKLTAGCLNVQQSGKIDQCRGAVLYANDESVTVTDGKDYSVTFTVVQGITRVGFKVTSTNANWAAVDNFRLYRLDTDITAQHAELQKLITEAEEVNGDGEGSDVLGEAIANAKNLIDAGNIDGIGTVAKTLHDATLNYRILNTTGSSASVTTNPFVAAGATVLLGRMTYNSSDEILEKGFCYSTSPQPTIFDNKTTHFFSSNGDIYWMEKLQPGTMYYVRAYILTTNYRLVYGSTVKVPTLPKGTVTADYDNGGSEEENYRISSAMEEIKWLYNNVSSVKGINLSIHYGADTPTADCSYGGWMRVGPNATYQQTGTMLHETNHGVGVGTSDVWWSSNYRENGDNGRWLGPRATQMIRFLNNDNGAYMTGDNTHMWPISSYSGLNYGMNGSWEDIYNPENTLLYYGNVLITHALHQDGLVSTSTVGFATPAYTFEQDDDTKYYIKTCDDANGNETSFLCVDEDGNLTQKVSSAKNADDNFAWTIKYNPKTAYYELRNVGTNRVLTNSDGQLRVVQKAVASTSERVQLLPSRSNYQKGTLDTSSYWITIGTTALKATGKTSVSSEGFDANDGNTKQHWLILTAKEMTAFDEYNVGSAMVGLDEVLASAHESMAVPTASATESMTKEEAEEPMLSLLTSIETSKGEFSVDDIEAAINDIRTAFVDYLGKVTPVSTAQPVPASWLIKNRGFDEGSDYWTSGPTSVEHSCAEFYETTFNTYQTISPKLPAGNYAVTASAFQRPGTYQDVYTSWAAGEDVVKAQLYATAGSTTELQTVQNIWDGARDKRMNGTCKKYNNLYIPDNMMAAHSWFDAGYYQNSVTISLDAETALKIGIRSRKSDTSWWTCFDNFGLYYFGSLEADMTGIDKVMVEDTANGKFIENGHLVIIRNGVKYNAQGVILK